MDFTKRPETPRGKVVTGLNCMGLLFLLNAGVIYAGAKLTNNPKNEEAAKAAVGVALMFGMASTLTELGGEASSLKSTVRAQYKK